MFKSTNISDYMLHNPVKVRSDDSIESAIKVIIDNKISGVCVIDASSNLIGVLSEMDCLRAILSAVYNNTNSVGDVSEFMSSDKLIVSHPNEDIVDIAQDMLKQNKRRRPVVRDGQLVGQITCRQLLAAVTN
ncbi:CBS domain-containing protein [Congregibacter sp.]|jgi:CBS domain-containing protein|uniref:CBS domain-containing protein n=1 Tax=Congregibacter sp. TaxID=2744308 RepID=UPI0039E3E273